MLDNFLLSAECNHLAAPLPVHHKLWFCAMIEFLVLKQRSTEAKKVLGEYALPWAVQSERRWIRITAAEFTTEYSLQHQSIILFRILETQQKKHWCNSKWAKNPHRPAHGREKAFWSTSEYRDMSHKALKDCRGFLPLSHPHQISLSCTHCKQMSLSIQWNNCVEQICSFAFIEIRWVGGLKPILKQESQPILGHNESPQQHIFAPTCTQFLVSPT